ncbi:MAG: hypothetical protein ACRDJK_01595, partial [Actinomycetota bacterium]
LPETFTSPRPALPGIDELSATLAEGLQARVRITMGKNKGKMVIEFGSFDELYRIAHRILPQPPAEAGAARE